MDRLAMLAEEFRAYKIETDDRLTRLEAAKQEEAPATDTSAAATPFLSTKKTDTAS